MSTFSTVIVILVSSNPECRDSKAVRWCAKQWHSKFLVGYLRMVYFTVMEYLSQALSFSMHTQSWLVLNKLLGFKEALQMPHLPEASNKQDNGLSNGPPQHTLVCALASLTEALFTILKNKITDIYQSADMRETWWYYHSNLREIEFCQSGEKEQRATLTKKLLVITWATLFTFDFADVSKFSTIFFSLHIDHSKSSSYERNT